MHAMYIAGAVRQRISLLLVALGVFLDSTTALGQQGTLGLVGGITQYDLSGVGTAPVIAFRGTTSLNRPVVFEVGFGYFSYSTQGEESTRHLLPEAQLQWQWTRTGLRPYLGAGLGASRASSHAGSVTDLSLSAAGGVRRPMAGGWTLVAELRLRAIDPWAATTADFGLGILGPFGGSGGSGTSLAHGASRESIALPVDDGPSWRVPAVVGFVLGAAGTYAWLHSGGSTSKCDRVGNQDAMSGGECVGLTIGGGGVGAGLGVLAATLLRGQS